ncbi:ATP-binding protein [Streptomyces sp. NPDC058470]|uniref:ATP-binding protein n=1 Tax=Streptomyces sp. NPDC058470 TaxID=3346515 RepID=UPI00365708DA
MDDDNCRHVRLPWTGADGKRCYLLGDGSGAGVLSRHADRVEAVQLGLAGRLLDRARQLIEVPDAITQPDQLGLLAAQLTLALHDALLIAESRGARLANRLPEAAVNAVGRGMHDTDDPAATNLTRGLNDPAGDSDIPQLIEIVRHAATDSPAAPHALGLLRLPGGDLASAGAARHYVRDTARSWGLPPDTVDTLETITGELAANALEHSHSRSVTVTLSLATQTATVSVTDEGRGRITVPETAGPGQERGRGLLIADTLANRWGQRRTGAGVTVWAEVTTDATPG